MGQILRLASFVAFLALGFRVARSQDDRRRRAIHALLAYVLAVNGLAGLTQHDDWPFTSHTIAVGRGDLDARVCLTEFAGIDGDGREWRIDPYTWSPLYDSVLQLWFDLNFQRLPDGDRRRVLAFLLERAEASRERRAALSGIGFERLLGPAASPYWLMLPRPAAVSPRPYHGLRVHRVCWTPRGKLENPRGETRTLVAELLR